MFNSESIHRQGDWICNNCQNLNYSFRKKCNRCKTQSREENQAHSVYSYYYYNKIDSQPTDYQLPPAVAEDSAKCASFNYQSPSARYIEFPEDNKQNCFEQWPGVLQTPKKKKPNKQSQNTKLDGLPSVSPLIKKYRKKQNHTTLEVPFSLTKKNNNNTTIFDSSSPANDFDTIRIRDFDKLIQDLSYHGSKGQIDASPYKEVIEQPDFEGVNFMKDIEESISKIII